jgi:hypothetical protein
MQAQEKWVVGQSPLTGGYAQFGKDIREGKLSSH